MPLCLGGERRLSAKWRRSRRNPKWLNIFKDFNSVRRKTTPQISHMGDWKIKKRPYLNRQRVPEICLERRMREPEPLLDVFEGKGEIIVVVEFASFKKDSLKINVEDHKLTLCAETLNRKYYKSLNLPKRVIPNTIHTTCKNGVLEIQLKKAMQEKTLDKVAD
jgi:HSP20 family molecular chaperone IbpA